MKSSHDLACLVGLGVTGRDGTAGGGLVIRHHSVLLYENALLTPAQAAYMEAEFHFLRFLP